MTPEMQKVLDRWGEVCQQHSEILEFLNWAEQERHIAFAEISLPLPARQQPPKSEWPDGKPLRRFASFTEVLNVYFDIDIRALDQARVMLLDEQLEANKAVKTG